MEWDERGPTAPRRLCVLLLEWGPGARLLRRQHLVWVGQARRPLDSHRGPRSLTWASKSSCYLNVLTDPLASVSDIFKLCFSLERILV